LRLCSNELSVGPWRISKGVDIAQYSKVLKRSNRTENVGAY